VRAQPHDGETGPSGGGPGRLAGKRVLVVGASRGVGRMLGERAAAEGARVSFAARSFERLKEAAAVGAGGVAVRMDVCDEASVEKAVAETVEELGGLDALVYAPAYGPLRRLRDADAALWRAVFDTNVIGATVVTRHVVDHLATSRGSAVYLSSVSEAGPVWAGLSLYGTSKAALARLVDSWRHERPEVVFTRLVLGPISGPGIASEFGADWDPELAAQLLPQWVARGLMDGVAQISARDCFEHVAAIFLSGAAPEWLVLQPRAGDERTM
jgi:NAD(P)-dependent dehydrogenase (short-subunit alcohol dehydrogenase family)